jgi:hypothetical protein
LDCKIKLIRREKSTKLFKSHPQAALPSPHSKMQAEEDNLPNKLETKLLQRQPSDRFPLIRRSDELQRETKGSPQVREKMKSEQNRK